MWDDSSDAQSALLWSSPDVAGQGQIQPLPHRDGVRCVAFSPNGQFVATGGEDNLARAGDSAALSLPEMRAHWEKLRMKHPEYFFSP